jgi:hypothetical protein
VRHGDRHPEQPRHIVQEPLGLAQRQPEHRPQAERAEDRHVALAPPLAANRPPAGEHGRVDPKGYRPARHQRPVVRAPVRYAVDGLRV